MGRSDGVAAQKIDPKCRAVRRRGRRTGRWTGPVEVEAAGSDGRGRGRGRVADRAGMGAACLPRRRRQPQIGPPAESVELELGRGGSKQGWTGATGGCTGSKTELPG